MTATGDEASGGAVPPKDAEAGGVAAPLVDGADKTMGDTHAPPASAGAEDGNGDAPPRACCGLLRRDGLAMRVLRPWAMLGTQLWPDLLSLTWWQAAFLFAFMVISILFSFLDVNYYLYPGTRESNDKLENDALFYTDRQRTFMGFSGAASFTGAVCVVFAAKGKYSNYSFGIVNATLYGLAAWAYGYAGDAQMNVLFFNVMQIVGMYTWTRHLDASNTAVVRTLGVRGWALVLAGATGLSAAFYWEIPAFAGACCRRLSGIWYRATVTHAPRPIPTPPPQLAEAIEGAYYYPGVNTPHMLDAVSNALSVMSQALLMMRFWEQWLLWITIDCMQIAMFSGINGYPLDINVLIMWSFFLANALFGLAAWFLRYRAQSQASTAAGAAPASAAGTAAGATAHKDVELVVTAAPAGETTALVASPASPADAAPAPAPAPEPALEPATV